MANPTIQTVQQLVAHHFEQNGTVVEGERHVAISASHKLHWANEAGIEFAEVESYLQEVREPIEPENKFQAVANYRLKFQ